MGAPASRTSAILYSSKPLLGKICNFGNPAASKKFSDRPAQSDHVAAVQAYPHETTSLFVQFTGQIQCLAGSANWVHRSRKVKTAPAAAVTAWGINYTYSAKLFSLLSSQSTIEKG
jgi:hypothetical protein